jgi:hypothetical protein
MDRWLPPDSAPRLAREKPRRSLLYPDAYAFVNAVCSGERPCPMPSPCLASLASAITSGSNCIPWSVQALRSLLPNCCERKATLNAHGYAVLSPLLTPA